MTPAARIQHNSDLFARLYDEAGQSQPPPAEQVQDDDLASEGRLSEPRIEDFE